MHFELFALILSVFSTIVAVASAYLARFKNGRVAVPPIRGFRVEPLNFHLEGEAYRSVRLLLTMTLMNTGAIPKAVNNLRVRLRAPNKKDGVLDWENEYEALLSQDGVFATQPMLGPYGSKSLIYSFINVRTKEMGTFVKEMEAFGEENPAAPYEAELQILNGDTWQTLRKFSFHYDGSNRIETDFTKINGQPS